MNNYIYILILSEWSWHATNQKIESSNIQMRLKRKKFPSSRPYNLFGILPSITTRRMYFDHRNNNKNNISTMKSFSLVVSIVIIIQQLSCVTSFDEKRHRAECQMWGKLENRTLPLQNQGHADCSVNKECTGFMCKGKYQVN